MEKGFKLHHYTSVESLEAILHNRTIRFSPLSKVNDTNEGETADLGNIGKYIFASCWTSNSNEKIDMWNLYGDNFKGVRITIPFPIFNEFYCKELGELPMLIDFEKSFFEKYLVLPTTDRNFIVPIKYSDDQNKLNPLTSISLGELDILIYSQIGTYKSKYWNFEEESRFLIYTIPSKNKIELNSEFPVRIGEGIELMTIGYDCGIDKMDLKINEEAFNQMEVTVGPKADDIVYQEILNYKSLFNKNLRIRKSVLAGKIR